jgi:hypothetical protein
MPPKLDAQPEQTLAALKVEKPEALTEEFLKDMDPFFAKTRGLHAEVGGVLSGNPNGGGDLQKDG